MKKVLFMFALVGLTLTACNNETTTEEVPTSDTTVVDTDTTVTGTTGTTGTTGPVVVTPTEADTLVPDVE